MCQWHMSSTDRSGEVGVRSTEQSVGIKVGRFEERLAGRYDHKQ